jgi:acetylornithine deacetylase
VSSQTDLTNPVDVAIDLMRIDSTSGSEGGVIARAESLLAGDGWITRRIPVSRGRDAIFATAHAAPTITLSTHLDTVPPYIPPRREGNVLHGRGACDAKGIAASMIVAARRLREQSTPVAMLFVVGEETTHDGAHAANSQPTTSRILINGEPTENTLALGTKGAMRVTVRTTGRAAHSAYPHLGRSATRDLVAMLAELDALELPCDEVLGDTTINIGRIEGGVADNVLAPAAEARLMARLVGPAEEMRTVFERWADGRASLEFGPTVPAVRLGVVPGFANSVAAYATDIPVLTNWGTPYLFGPGSIHVAHTDDEHVRIEDLDEAVEGYTRLVLELLRTPH